MNTDVQTSHDVQKTHRIVVGAGVALIAAAGIGTVALNVHRAVASRTVPAVTYSGNSTIASPTPAAAVPPPPTEAPTLPSANANASAAPEAAVNQVAPVPSATAPKVTSQGSSGAAVRQYRSAAAAPTDSPVATGEPRFRAVDSAAPAVAVNQHPTVVSATPGASASVGDESLFARNAASNAATADIAPGNVAIAPAAMNADGANATRNSLPTSAGASTSDSEVSGTAQARAAGGDAANSDRIITDAAQTQIAAATEGQGASIAVNTLNGLVILTGTAPSPAVVEHVKQVVQQVKNVQGVDATAVRISSP